MTPASHVSLQCETPDIACSPSSDKRAASDPFVFFRLPPLSWKKGLPPWNTKPCETMTFRRLRWSRLCVDSSFFRAQLSGQRTIDATLKVFFPWTKQLDIEILRDVKHDDNSGHVRSFGFTRIH